MERPEPDEVVRCLATTSAKIRALATAGYERTAISKYLDIRYQHVRKVLLDSGITGGLRQPLRVKREPIIVEDGVAVARQTISWEVLLKAGFIHLGEWTVNAGGEIKLDQRAPVSPGIYAFVIEEEVVYVGLTNNGLHIRLEGYRRGHAGQRTNARVKKLILEGLAQGKRVKVLVAMPGSTEWNGLPVNVAAGMESGLIQMIRPAWNILGAK